MARTVYRIENLSGRILSRTFDSRGEAEQWLARSDFREPVRVHSFKRLVEVPKTFNGTPYVNREVHRLARAFLGACERASETRDLRDAVSRFWTRIARVRGMTTEVESAARIFVERVLKEYD